MKTSQRQLILNKYLIISSILVIVIPFISWGIFSTYFSCLIDLDMTDIGGTRAEYFRDIFPFHLYPVDGYMLMQLIAPVFPVLAVMGFFQTKKIMAYSYVRGQSYADSIVKQILKRVTVASCALYLAYVIFLIIGRVILTVAVDEGTPRQLFSDILGKNFYNDHVVMYFLLDGFVKYFILTFVYGLFAIAVSFLTPKTYICVLAPVAYYAVFAIVVAVLETATKANFLYLSPTYTVVSDSREYVNTAVVFAPLLPPLLFSIAVIARDLRKKKNRGDVFATT